MIEIMNELIKDYLFVEELSDNHFDVSINFYSVFVGATLFLYVKR